MPHLTLGQLLKIHRKSHHLTQKQLADELSFSTSTISRYESDASIPSVDFIKNFAKALELSRKDEQQLFEMLDEHEHPVAVHSSKARASLFSEELLKIRRDYHAYLIDNLKDHRIQGFAPQLNTRIMSLPLAKIFFPLRVEEGRPLLSQYAEEDLRISSLNDKQLDRFRRAEKQRQELDEDEDEKRILNLVDLLRNNRIVVLGDPGMGKTTMTRYISYALAAEDFTRVGKSLTGVSPILVRLAEYGQALEKDPTLHLSEYIEKELHPREIFGNYLKEAILQGRCFIILDGLDEITIPFLRMQVTERIQKMAAAFGQNRFMVTSRIIGYDLSPLTRDFAHATIQEMRLEDKESFVNLWYEAIHTVIRRENNTTKRDLIEALRDKPQIGRIATNPLLLTIIILKHWSGTKLPNRRIQIYEVATDTLLEYWTARRGVDLDAIEIKRILAPIAFHIVSSSVSAVISERDLRPKLYKNIAVHYGCTRTESIRLGNQLLENLNEHSGLFVERGVDVDQRPVYGFSHLTFCEYLAALYLADLFQHDELKIGKYIHIATWHEPLLLMAGYLSLHPMRSTQVDDFIQNLLEYPTLYEGYLQRNLLFVAECLADDISISHTLKDQIFLKLAALLSHPSPQVRKAARQQFEMLSGTRRHKAAAAEALMKQFPLDHLDQFEVDIQINILATLFTFGERDRIHKNLLALEQQTIGLLETFQTSGIEQSHLNEIRELRFCGWPTLATNYLLQIILEKGIDFIAKTSIDISNSHLEYISIEAIIKTIGFKEFDRLANIVLEKVNDYRSHDQLRWLILVAKEDASSNEFTSFLSSNRSDHLRYLASKYLLETDYDEKAVATLVELIPNSNYAVKAAEELNVIGKSELIDWRIIASFAFMTDSYFDRLATSAIELLFQTGQHELGLLAAIHMLCCFQPLATYKMDESIQTTIETLIKYGEREIGLAAAKWLALTPRYQCRVEASTLLLEVGEVDIAIELLKQLVHESNSSSLLKASDSLFKCNQHNIVVSSLQLIAEKAEPFQRYEAYQKLSQIHNVNRLEYDSQPNELRLNTLHERIEIMEAARREFVQLIQEKLDIPTAQNNEDSHFQTVRRALQKFYERHLKSETGRLNPLGTSITLNLALLKLRTGGVNDFKYDVQLILATIDSLPFPIKTRVLRLLEYIVIEGSPKYLIPSLSSNDFDAERSLIRTLMVQENSEFNEMLSDRITHEDRYIRIHGVWAAGQANNEKETRAIIGACFDESPAIRWHSVHALGQLSQGALEEIAKQLISDEQWRVRRALLYSLSFSDDISNLEPLILPSLNDRSSAVRASATQLLRKSKNYNYISRLLLCLDDDDISVRDSAAQTLDQLSSTVATKLLLSGLNSPSNNIRSYSAQILGWFADPTTIQPLNKLLMDKSRRVRLSAAYALDLITGKSQYAPTLLLDALDDPDDECFEVAVTAAGELRIVESIPKLVRLLPYSNIPIRISIIRAIGFIGHSSGIHALVTSLGDTAPLVRLQAADSLGIISDSNSHRFLKQSLRDEHSSVRSNAAESLGKTGDFSAIPNLISALVDQGRFGRSQISNALARLEAIESVPVIEILSGAQDSYEASGIAAALIHLDPARSLKILDRYARQFGWDNWVERRRGQALWKLGETEQARHYFQSAVSRTATFENLLALAHFHLEHKNWKQAEMNIQSAIEHGSRYERAHGILSHAALLWLKNKKTDAMDEFNDALRRFRRSINLSDLKYEHFWNTKALAAAEEMNLTHTFATDST